MGVSCDSSPRDWSGSVSSDVGKWSGRWSAGWGPPATGQGARGKGQAALSLFPRGWCHGPVPAGYNSHDPGVAGFDDNRLERLDSKGFPPLGRKSHPS